MTAAAVNIASFLMLVKVSISTWTGRKTDNGAARVAEAALNCSGKALSVVKHLADSAEFKAIHKEKTRLYNWLSEMLAPWADGGWRVLPCATFEAFETELMERRRPFDAAVQAWLTVAEDQIHSAENRARLGDLYHTTQWPTRAELADQFGVELEVGEVSVADFRSQLSGEVAERLARREVDRAVQRLHEAQVAVWGRLHNALLELATVNKKQRIHGTLLSNLLDLVAVMDRLNVTQDPQLTAMRDEITATLDGFTVDQGRSKSGDICKGGAPIKDDPAAKDELHNAATKLARRVAKLTPTEESKAKVADALATFGF